MWIAERVLRLHPMVLTIVLLAALVGPSLVEAISPALATGLLVIAVCCLCGWLWAVCTASLARDSASQRRWMPWILLAPPMILLAAAIANWPLQNSPAALAFFATLFVGIWLTARALEGALSADRPKFGPVFGTFLQLYFAFVGVWTLRSKILRLLDAPQAT